ncbi:GGDEF domain-containing protein [Pseudahrensia aquimaris]|uniref:GGDEF domain-containing protein n=1 Tax=Pseudahrensia aquimaris TaxID=744461 RepID=A0ABW3FFD0_9HYPH
MSIEKTSLTPTIDDLQFTSRHDLEREVAELRNLVKEMKLGKTVDDVSGLANRGNFLDQANAEFSRARRYGHELTLVVTDILNLQRHGEEHGDTAPDQIIMAVAQMCLSSSRYGVDVLGRITENQIAIMLPETPLAGGLQFMSRMRRVVTETPIMLDNGSQVKPGIKVSADMLRPEDDSFMDLFQRTWKRTKKNPATKKSAVA